MKRNPPRLATGYVRDEEMERPLKHPSYAPRLVRRYYEGISRQTHAHRAAGSPHFITKKTIHHVQKPVPCMRQTCMLEFIRTGVADAPRRSPRPCLNCNCNCTASPESPLPIHTCPRLPIYNAPFIPSVSSRHARYWIPPSTPRDHHHQPIQNGLHACIRGSESKKRKGKKIRRTEDMTTPLVISMSRRRVVGCRVRTQHRIEPIETPVGKGRRRRRCRCFLFPSTK